MAKREMKQGTMLPGADVRTSERMSAKPGVAATYPRPSSTNRRYFLGVDGVESSRPSQMFSDPGNRFGPPPVHERLLLAFLSPLTRS